MIIRRQIVLLLVWNFVWLGFAVDQIQISVEALQQSNNIYGDKVVVDRNGTKFLVDKNRLKNDKFDTDHTPVFLKCSSYRLVQFSVFDFLASVILHYFSARL